MRAMLLVHIAMGAVGLLSGFLALWSAKGETVHRKAGMVFVFSMLGMCGAGLVIAVARGVAPAINVPAALLTASLVVTALTTVRPPSAAARWLDRGAMVVASAVGVACLAFAFQAVANGGTRNGMPAFPFFLFGFVGLLAGALDVRMMRAGGLRGPARLRRHLWRMSFALFIAALSFFIGQAKVIPAPLRIFPLLALPVLAVLVTMLYQLWRVRARRADRAAVPVRAARTA